MVQHKEVVDNSWVTIKPLINYTKTVTGDTVASFFTYN